MSDVDHLLVSSPSAIIVADTCRRRFHGLLATLASSVAEDINDEILMEKLVQHT
jgi:hypothetical protein